MAMTARYTVIEGQVIAEKRGGVRSSYVPDPLGSTVALLDNTQAKSDTFTYWPYGETKARTGTTPTPFRFVGTLGYYLDTNGYYVRAREYQARHGRWLTSDPLWPVTDAYSYTDCNPLSVSDRSGMAPWPGIPPSEANCKLYKDLCDQGYLFGCNSWFACMYRGNSKESNCTRQCLQRLLKARIKQGVQLRCDEWINDHAYCFRVCGYDGKCTNIDTLRMMCYGLLRPNAPCIDWLRRHCGWPISHGKGILPKGKPRIITYGDVCYGEPENLPRAKGFFSGGSLTIGSLADCMEFYKEVRN